MWFLQITTATSSGFFRKGYDTVQVWDMVLTPIYFFFIIVFFSVLRNIILEKESLIVKRFFMWGLILKMLGAIALGLVYQFYYSSGDTAIYFSDSLIIHYAFNQNLNAWWHLMWTDVGKVDPSCYDYMWQLTMRRDPQGFFVDKIVSLVNLLTFRTYFPSAIIMAVMSFTGAWALYRTLTDIYPQLKTQLGFAVFLIPSAFFWGSGIGKDSITFGSLGWVTWGAYHLFIKQRKIFLSLLMLLIHSYLIGKIKPYILFSFIPALAFWILIENREKITNKFFKRLTLPVTIFISIVSGYYLVLQLGNEFAQYSITNAISTAQNFQDYHTYLAETSQASGYNLGAIDGTAWGAIKKFFPSVNVTLFRPYLWEAGSFIILISALESFVIFLLTIRIFFKHGILNTLSMITRKPVILFCLIFALIFAYAVGYSAYNFGALVRYKIPCLPFYVGVLFMLEYELSEKKRKQQLAKYGEGELIIEVT